MLVNSKAVEKQRKPKTAPLLGGQSSLSAPTAKFIANDAAHGYFECKTTNESSWSVCSSPFDLSTQLPDRGDELTFAVRSVNPAGSAGPTSEKVYRRGYADSKVNGDPLASYVLPDDSFLLGGTFLGVGGHVINGALALKLDGSYYSIFENVGTGQIYSVATQSDGKTILAGNFTSYNSQTPGLNHIVRLNADGSVDTAFAANAGTGFDADVRRVLVLSTGKILVVGQFTSYDGDAATPDRIALLNADGTEDTAFRANAGTGLSSFAMAAIEQSDGKILVGGAFSAYNGDNATPNDIVRINADGTEDLTFRASAGAGLNGWVWAIELQSDGKIIVGGEFGTYAGNASAPERIIRLNTDGTEDTTFRTNVGGGFSTEAGSGVRSLAIQGDDKIIATGRFLGFGGNASAPDNVIRLNADGTEDTAFRMNAGSGLPNPGVGINVEVHAALIQADGKILIGGDQFNAYGDDEDTPQNIVRLNTDGTEDLSFRANANGGFTGKVSALAQRDDGTLIVGGTLGHYGAGTMQRIARFDANGDVNAEFSANAGAGFDASVNVIEGYGDDKLLIGGAFTTYAGDAAVPDGILRINLNGSVDTTFSTHAGVGFDAGVLAIAKQSDGKILVGGNFTTYAGNAATPDRIVRLNADGSEDTAFRAAAGAGFDNTVTSIVVQPSGKILVAGYFSSYDGDNDTPDYLVRLNADGSEDLSFRAVIGAGPESGPEKLLQQTDGKILVGGWFENFDGADVSNGILRLNADGSPDTAFNANVGTEGGSGFNAFAVQSDGKILAGGWYEDYNGDSDAPDHVLRLNADGSEDTSVRAQAGTGLGDWCASVAIDSQGRWLVGGTFKTYDGVDVPKYFMRLMPDGSFFD